jgi:hypothetical protein
MAAAPPTLACSSSLAQAVHKSLNTGGSSVRVCEDAPSSAYSARVDTKSCARDLVRHLLACSYDSPATATEYLRRGGQVKAESNAHLK